MRLISTILLMLLPLSSGAEVVIELQNGKISYRLRNAPFLNEKSKKELKSGISSQVVILARLVESPERTVTQQIVSLDAKYDLWEESFRLQYSDGRKITLKKQSEVESAIESPGPYVVYDLSELRNEASYRIQIVQTVNPLDADRLEAVRKWVIGQQSTLQAASSPKDQVNRATGSDSTFTELFYSLWKRASAGELLVGEVSREILSPLFTKESLKKAEGKRP